MPDDPEILLDSHAMRLAGVQKSYILNLYVVKEVTLFLDVFQSYFGNLKNTLVICVSVFSPFYLFIYLWSLIVNLRLFIFLSYG